MDEDYPVLYATLGLAAYRNGNFDTGRECYVRAIEDLTKEKRLKTAASASLFWIREELRINPSSESTLALFDQIKKMMPRITKGEKNPEIDSMLEYLDAFAGVANIDLPQVVVERDGAEEIMELADTYLPNRNGDTSPAELVSRAI
ncbi:hypothetical protein C1924_15270 [Stenotrophomonas sp. ESTM1D_MKCIP4_1]|nr:hypothetical protein C1924_15270 [Stenotrophomonas sp. ESTM1D_MKCIP4_1]